MKILLCNCSTKWQESDIYGHVSLQRGYNSGMCSKCPPLCSHWAHSRFPVLSCRTYFDNIVAIDSLLEHIMVGCRLFTNALTYRASRLVGGGVFTCQTWAFKGVRRGLEAPPGFFWSRLWILEKHLSVFHYLVTSMENIYALKTLVFRCLCICAGLGVPSWVSLTWRSMRLHLRHHLVSRPLALPHWLVFFPQGRCHTGWVTVVL